MKVALYARVSTKEQDLYKQITQLKEWAERSGHEIYNIYPDVISGTKAKRPHFDRLLDDMRHYKFHAVVVTKLDRIARSLSHLMTILTEMKNKRVEFIVTTQNIDTSTASGKLQWQIMGAFAEWEAELISERTKEGLKYAKNVGKRGKDKKPRKKRGGLRK